MKHLKELISEKLIINKNTKVKNYNYHPEDKKELETIILNLIKERGTEADLNDIDTSNIKDMSYLFSEYDEKTWSRDSKFKKFDGDISEWDVSKVENMRNIFYHSEFSGKHCDLSKWDVSNVEDMHAMFNSSKFNQDISKWNVSKVEDMSAMFFGTKFNQDISKWNVSNVENMNMMFYANESFNQDISNWDVSNVKSMINMFYRCPLEKNPPKWYKK